MINYIQGDLFDDKTSILLHACNCKNLWKSGVAASFAKYFPVAYTTYQHHAANPGDLLIIEDRQTIVCLYTSKNYGQYVDSVEQILNSTRLSLDRLGDHFKNQNVVISSPKINSGLFKVPWEKTEALIETFLVNHPNIKWNVYCL